MRQVYNEEEEIMEVNTKWCTHGGIKKGSTKGHERNKVNVKEYWGRYSEYKGNIKTTKRKKGGNEGNIKAN